MLIGNRTLQIRFGEKRDDESSQWPIGRLKPFLERCWIGRDNSAASWVKIDLKPDDKCSEGDFERA